MIAPRVIPVLQIDRDGWLVKTKGYRSPRYLGDPINAVKIFNEKQVDELVVVDIDASRSGTAPSYDLLEDIASEAFMPVAYGGGVRSLDNARRVIDLGIEKVVVNSCLATHPQNVERIAAELGSQSVIASVDIRRHPDGTPYATYASATKDTGLRAEVFTRRAVNMGVGEILASFVDREGLGTGYDLDALRRITGAVNVPVIAYGGARSMEHFREGLAHGASAVAAGSKFVFYGRNDAVLITYPEPEAIAMLCAGSRDQS